MALALNVKQCQAIQAIDSTQLPYYESIIESEYRMYEKTCSHRMSLNLIEHQRQTHHRRVGPLVRHATKVGHI